MKNQVMSLDVHQETQLKRSDGPTLLVLEEKIKKLLEQVEMLGEAGKVDEAEERFVEDAKDHIDVQGFNVYHKIDSLSFDRGHTLLIKVKPKNINN
ncbi:hypothetical protein QJS10_CPA09g01378 [Acorus calamus]|uniref:Uncharacterized protein n=1 Tax=Acorus calamus TaxID=4465 RepID=A0AAV9E4J6_ACOCL|nr:hypothetical protein QJS10_CPA09g01378 [Acorus calamus]